MGREGDVKFIQLNYNNPYNVLAYKALNGNTVCYNINKGLMFFCITLLLS